MPAFLQSKDLYVDIYLLLCIVLNPLFFKVKFCCVPVCVLDWSRCAVGEKSLQNTGIAMHALFVWHLHCLKLESVSKTSLNVSDI